MIKTGKTAVLTLAFALLAVFALTPAVLAADEKACPWNITGVKVGKWDYGKLQAGLLPQGYFPLHLGIERPSWYINGSYVGKTQRGIGGLWLPNSSGHLKNGQSNTIEVKFSKPPDDGTSSKYTFTFDESQIPVGGYIQY